MPGKQWHILLADDDKFDRYFFDLALKELSIDTRLSQAEDGEKLMQLLTTSTELPDVIFLDLNMPLKKGDECLVEIKANKNLAQIPVIIYSTSLHPEVTDLLYRNGAHYYLKKCDFDKLPAAIQEILQLLSENPQQPTREKFIVHGI